MNLNLRENMYIRTKDGIIDKILKLNKSYVKGVSQKDELYAYDIDNIVKASYNIIDILKEGDYVNGHRVDKVVIGPKCSYVLLEEVGYYVDTQKDIDDYEIKSVLTSQQFESLEYKIV